MSNFLPLPYKRAGPIPDLGPRLLSYITTHFRDAHPEAFRRDVDQFVALRREWVESKGEAHPEGVKGLMRYHAQLAFLVTKFPSDIGVPFAYHLPFPPPFSLTPDAPISLNSLSYERASVLYNIAALYGAMAAAERRADIEGIKRALGYLSAAAGVIEYIIKSILPTLRSELPSPNAAGYDMTESFLGTIREFVLAQAQECFWQQAVMQGSYKDPIVAKLSMKVSEYYKSALASANSAEYPSAAFFPVNWTSHMTIKQIHFEAAAQWRMSREELNKGKYGEEIARLKAADALAKKGLSGAKGVADAVAGDLRDLQNAVKSSLERAIRDNDLVYVAPVPSTSQLAPISGAGMVKLATPVEISDPTDWLMKGGAGTGPLFSALVPYGVHLALSVYDDRKDTLVRELDGRREELDGLAASTLQSLNLPGSIQALERPVGLPPSLLSKSEEVDATGGIRRITSLLEDVARLSKANARTLSDAMDILDDEATESEQLVERQPHLAHSRAPSHVANANLIQMAQQYETTIKQASQSDATVRQKWQEWQERIRTLEDGEDSLTDYIPNAASSTISPAVRPLRASLEDLDDRIAYRATLIRDVKGISKSDDIRTQVLAEASRMAHGGSGEVRPEWFEPIFEKALEKYERIQRDMTDENGKQEALLAKIRDENETFIKDRKDDPRVRGREAALQEMDMAYWKYKEISDNLTEGLGFYNQLADILRQFKGTCTGFLNARRADVGSITEGMQNVSVNSSPAPQQQQQYHSQPPQQQQQQQHLPAHQTHPPSHSSHHSSSFNFTAASHPVASAPPPRAPSPPRPFLAHPNSSAWQSGADFLPPPPPQPVLRSGGVPAPAPAPSFTVDSPRRVTRSSAKGPIGDAEKNPYKGSAKSRRDGGVV